MLSIKQHQLLHDIIGRDCNNTPQDFFDVLNKLEEIEFYNVIEMVMDDYQNCQVFYMLRQPDFIERFMEAVCREKGVE
jgi:hypothetical protein